MSSSHTRAGQTAAGAVLGIGADIRDAEMPATEKDLAEDAPWKKIQQNTFTRWCNEHLKCVSKRIANLQTDLSDGLRLIALLEVLSQKKMHRKHNQRPTFRQMQLENVSVALEFLDRESIKLVSIGEGTGRPVALAGRGWGFPRVLPSSLSRPLADIPLSCGAAPGATQLRAGLENKGSQPSGACGPLRAPPAGPRLAHAQAELTSSTGRAPAAAPALATLMEDWTSLGQHKRKPEFPVLTRESRRNS